MAFTLPTGYEVLDPSGNPVTHPADRSTDLVVDLSQPRYQGLQITAVDFDGTGRVWFDALGEPYQADGVTELAAVGSVTLTDREGTIRTITVRPATGKVAIQ